MKSFLLTTTSICLLAGLAAAQVPLPPYTNTYTGNTRGFYFQAPTLLVVTGVQVPNETKVTGANKQMVALYKLKTAPPAFSSTVDATPVFFKMGQPASAVLPVTGVIYQKGDWVAVLGACGLKTGSVRCSYAAAGGFNSSVLGFPVTIKRCGTQANLGTIKGVCSASGGTGLWAEDAYNVCRIRLFIAGQGQAMTYDMTSGTSPAALLPDDTFPPMIGKTGKLNVRRGATSTGAGGLLSIGLLKSEIKVPGLGTLLGFPYLILLPVGPVPAAGLTVSIPIPNNTAYLGQSVYMQGAMGGAASTTDLTNGMHWTVNN